SALIVVREVNVVEVDPAPALEPRQDLENQPIDLAARPHGVRRVDEEEAAGAEVGEGLERNGLRLLGDQPDRPGAGGFAGLVRWAGLAASPLGPVARIGGGIEHDGRRNAAADLDDSRGPDGLDERAEEVAVDRSEAGLAVGRTGAAEDVTAAETLHDL